jgi:hypothetical protein
MERCDEYGVSMLDGYVLRCTHVRTVSVAADLLVMCFEVWVAVPVKLF